MTMMLRFLAALLLLLASSSSTSTAEKVDWDFDRRLQTAACGDTIATLTPADILGAGRALVSQLVDPSVLDATMEVLFETAEFNVRVMKMCGSCQAIDNWYFEMSQLFPGWHERYCGATRYSWGGLHSFLVVLPLDPATGELFDLVRLRFYLSFRESRLNIDSAPTIAGVNSNPYLTGLLAASSGSLTIFPDYMGYGENQPGFNRTTMWQEGYQQAGIVAILSMQKWLEESTGGCTLFDKTVTIQGMGDGAFGAILVADAIRGRRFGWKILKVFAGAPILDLTTFLEDAVASYQAGSAEGSTIHPYLLSIFAHSAETLGVNNTGSGAKLVAPAYAQDIINWVGNPNPLTVAEITALLPANPASIVNPLALTCNTTSANATGTSRPALCQALAEASAWRIMSHDPDDLIYTIEVCYSEDDSIASPRQIPDFLFEVDDPKDPFDHEDFKEYPIEVYKGPLGFEDGLKPQGNHARATLYCSISPMLFHNLLGHAPDDVTDRSYFMQPLSQEERDLCLTGTVRPNVPTTPTSAPVLAPGVSPGGTSANGGAPGPGTSTNGNSPSATSTNGGEPGTSDNGQPGSNSGGSNNGGGGNGGGSGGGGSSGAFRPAAVYLWGVGLIVGAMMLVL